MTTRSPSFLTVAIVLLAVVVTGLVVITGYQYARAAMLASAVDAQRQALRRDEQQTAQRLRFQQDTKALSERVPQQTAPWTWSEQLPVVMEQLAALADDSGATIETLQPAPVVQKQAVTRFPLRLTLHTSLASLSALLRKVQQATPALAVDQMAVRAGSKPGEPLTVELTLSSYVIITGRQATGGRR